MKRRRCNFNTLNIPNIREVCSVYFDRTTEPLTPHIHPQAMEICFVVSGHQSYCVNSVTYDISGGEIFLTYPDEEHFGGWLFQEKCMLYYLIVDTVNFEDDFLGFGKDSHSLFEMLNHIDKRTFFGGENIKKLFENVFAVWDDSENPLRTVRLKCAVFELLYEIAKCSKDKKLRLSADMEYISQYIDDNITKKLSLSELADISGLSLAGFKRKFRSQFGIPPADCIMRRKIEYSKNLLLSGKSVTQTAYDMDFSSSQHFSSAFKKCCGISPAQFVSLGKMSGQK